MTKVAGWSPAILVSPEVDRARIAPQLDRFAWGYTAPDIEFSLPEGLLVAGGSWAVMAQTRGLLPDSVHLMQPFRWETAFASQGERPRLRMVERQVLVAGNVASSNHFHWTAQSVGTLLAAGAAGLLDGKTALLLPPLTTRQGEALEMLGIDAPIEALEPDALALAASGITCNINGGQFAFAPHPQFCALFRDSVAGIKAEKTRRLYLSRTGRGGRRVLDNEHALEAMLKARGFEVIDAGALSMAQQVATFRHAATIVAPHGAALANLLWAEDGTAGPRLIELMQEDYLNRCYLKLAQAKRLDYACVLCPSTAGSDPHRSRWTADLALVEQSIG